MASKKERYQKILNYKIDKEKDLLKAWKKYNIDQGKIDKLEAKKAAHEAKKAEVDAMP